MPSFQRSHPVRAAALESLRVLAGRFQGRSAGTIRFDANAGWAYWIRTGEGAEPTASRHLLALFAHHVARVFAPALRAWGAERGALTFDFEHVALWGGARLLALISTPGLAADRDPLRFLFTLAVEKPGFRRDGFLVLGPAAEASGHERLQAVRDRQFLGPLDVLGFFEGGFQRRPDSRLEIRILEGLLAAQLLSEDEAPVASRIPNGVPRPPEAWAAALPMPRLTPVQKRALGKAARGPVQAGPARSKRPNGVHPVPTRVIEALEAVGLLGFRPGVAADYWPTGPVGRLRPGEDDVVALRRALAASAQMPDAAHSGAVVIGGDEMKASLERLHRMGLVFFRHDTTIVTPAALALAADVRRERRILLSPSEAKSLLSGRKTAHLLADGVHATLDRRRNDPAVSDPGRLDPGTRLVFEVRRNGRRRTVARAAARSAERADVFVPSSAKGGRLWRLGVEFRDRDPQAEDRRCFCAALPPGDRTWRRLGITPDPRFRSLAEELGFSGGNALSAFARHFAGVAGRSGVVSGMLVRFRNVRAVPRRSARGRVTRAKRGRGRPA